MINGNMAVAASGQGGLLVRVPPDATETLLDDEHASPMVMRGREARGWIRVDTDGVRTEGHLKAWVERGADYARSLPPK
jgi:hypothetical protein